MADQHRLSFLILLVALILGCRKDKDSEPPKAIFLQPVEGFSVNIPDTIAVVVAVSDDRLVESLTVLVANMDGVPIAPAVVVSVGAREQTIHIDLPLTDERIESGGYVLTARANDGSQDGRAFRGLVVQAAPLRVRSTFLVPPPSQSPPFILTRIDSSGAPSTFVTLDELGGATLDREYLYTAGTAMSPLRRWNLNSGGPSILASNPGTGSTAVPYFLGLVRDPVDGRIYVGTQDRQLLGFSISGVQVFSANTLIGFRSEATAVVGDNLISSAYNPVLQQRMLVQHAYSSGVLLSQWPSSVAPIGLSERDASHLLLFGNTAEGGAIQEINVLQGGVFTMREFPGEPIQCVTRLAPGTYALGFASGVRRFDYQSNAVVPLASGMNAACLTFNPVSGALLVGSGSSLIELDPLTGATGAPWIAPHDIGAIHLQLNR
ncbi:MAG: hypothetical protein IPM46_07120 [Flavobacteriales bacterium]|nr:hypothetical protein [Flavobacteriales bacterium]